MPPYRQGRVIEFSLRPAPTPLHQSLFAQFSQQPPPQPPTASSLKHQAAQGSIWTTGSILSTSVQIPTPDDSYDAIDGSTSNSDPGTDTDWSWMDEDRLQRTPAEQSMLEEHLIQEQDAMAARIERLELSTFPTLCDFLSTDTCASKGRYHRRKICGDSEAARRANSRSCNLSNRVYPIRRCSPEPVASKTAWGTSAGSMIGGDVCCLASVMPPPMPLSTDFFDHQQVTTRAQANNSNLPVAGTKMGTGAGAGTRSCNQSSVASGRTLQDIETAVQLTRNNSNQQQRYEMRGGHIVEICSRVEFPDRSTRNVSVTVEATHSNGCHRVIMLKGLTAKKRPDLGPKVKDCRLRMDQIVMTRPTTSTHDWVKTITMSYDSDFQVGVGEKSRAL